MHHITGYRITLCSLSVLAAVILSCPGCAGQATIPEQPGATPGALVQAWQTFPTPSEIAARRTSDLNGQLNGSAFDQAAIPPQNVVIDGTYAEFTPDWDPAGLTAFSGLAYALYILPLGNYDGLQQLQFDWAVTCQAGQLWLGLGDCTRDCWEWHAAPFSEIDDTAHYLDAEGNLLLLVLLTGKTTASLSKIWYRLTPSAVITTTPDPATGDPPLAVSFDGSASSSPNGAIVQYEWDWDGDGVYDYNGGAVATAAHEYAGPGGWRACLRVTDALGARGRGYAVITCHGTYKTTVVASEYALYPCLEIVDANPAISYYDENSESLKYVRAADPFGNAWNDPVTVSSAEMSSSSLKVVSGRPAIAFYYRVRPYYVRALDAQGRRWGTPVCVHDVPCSGFDPQLEIVDGRPAMAFCYWANSDMMYVRAANATGSAWGDPLLVYDDTIPSNTTAMAVLDSGPAIAFEGFGGSHLSLVKADDALGAAWGAAAELDTDAHTGRWGCMVVFNHLPGICYQKSDLDGLYFMLAKKPDATEWNGPSLVAAISDYGAYSSLAEVDGRPAVSYADAPDRRLCYIRAANALGTLWTDPPLVVDDTPNVDVTSLDIVAGAPAIAYSVNQELRYARMP